MTRLRSLVNFSGTKEKELIEDFAGTSRMAYKTDQGEALGRILMVLIKFIHEISKKTIVMAGLTCFLYKLGKIYPRIF